MCLLAELLSSYGRMSVYAYELVEIHLKSLQLRPLPGQGPFETHDTWQGPERQRAGIPEPWPRGLVPH